MRVWPLSTFGLLKYLYGTSNYGWSGLTVGDTQISISWALIVTDQSLNLCVYACWANIIELYPSPQPTGSGRTHGTIRRPRAHGLFFQLLIYYGLANIHVAWFRARCELWIRWLCAKLPWGLGGSDPTAATVTRLTAALGVVAVALRVGTKAGSVGARGR